MHFKILKMLDTSGFLTAWQLFRIGTVDVLRACDACADMHTAYSV